jgi:predicted  nucleic acid-binding Zn-ribbon protein
MDETLLASPKTAAEYRAAIDAMAAEMERMHERSEERWVDIERLKGESKAIRAQTDRTLDRIDARLSAIEALL